MAADRLRHSPADNLSVTAADSLSPKRRPSRCNVVLSRTKSIETCNGQFLFGLSNCCKAQYRPEQFLHAHQLDWIGPQAHDPGRGLSDNSKGLLQKVSFGGPLLQPGAKVSCFGSQSFVCEMLDAFFQSINVYSPLKIPGRHQRLKQCLFYYLQVLSYFALLHERHMQVW